MGYAKPLGFGSVKITVTQVEIDDLAHRYASLEQRDKQDALADKERWVDLFRQTLSSMYDDTDFSHLPNIEDLLALAGEPPDLPIHYPRTTRTPAVEGKNFEWFVGNKRAGRNAGPRLSLPLAVRDNEGLPLLNKKGREIK